MLSLQTALSGPIPAPVPIGAALSINAPPHLLGFAAMGSSFLGLILVMGFAHCLCDYPLQTDTVALGKCPGSDVVGVPWPYWMAGHCGTHALAVALITGVPLLGAAEFVAHFLIDTLKCKRAINLNTDQSLHLICKVIWAICAGAIA
jgi:hypothetical protein